MMDLLSKILMGRSVRRQPYQKLMIDLSGPSFTKATFSQRFANIRIEKIHPNKEQVRTVFTQKTIIELSKSMEHNGILQPILVRNHPDRDEENEPPYYQIVAGERRWRAAKLANIAIIPCLILNLDDLQVAQIGLVENIQRKGLEPLEEAKAFKALVEEYQHTPSEIGHSIGKTRSYVTNRIRLLSLPNAVQDSLSNNEISSGHARAIITTDDPAALYQEIVSKKLSVRQTESMVNSIKQGTGDSLDKNSEKTQYVEYLVGRLKRTFPKLDTLGVKVKDGIRLDAKFDTVEDFEAFILSLETNIDNDTP